MIRSLMLTYKMGKTTALQLMPATVEMMLEYLALAAGACLCVLLLGAAVVALVLRARRRSRAPGSRGRWPAAGPG